MSSTAPDGPVRGVRRDGPVVTVDAAGEIDLHSSPALLQSLLSLLDQNPSRLVVNLADVTYMDSSGIASLVKVLSRARKGGNEFVLTNLQERVRSVFEITRLTDVFTIS